ncbi:TonB-dependent receptor [Marinifilum sp.]|uniref:TonB-dependent receptor n=1 Tax=Marinifilum sp. TaxID=2033137 RepID=UPI003BA8CAA3
MLNCAVLEDDFINLPLLKKIRLYLFIAIFLLGMAPNGLEAKNTCTISGTVFNGSTLQPIEFANVTIKNTNRGCTTDLQGRFKITIGNTQDIVLTISHINFETQEYALGKNNKIRILLIPKNEQLSQVVISAHLYEQNLNKLTKPATIIAHGEILDNMNSNMTDMLASTPGFTQVWEYHSPIILRGLNSNRLIIMKDGNRRIGTFPGGYFGQDMNIYDTKKVEVIKGPGSVIYGSGAISGIINVISQDVFGPKNTDVKISSGYGSNNNEFLELFKIKHSNQKFGISVNGKFRKTGDIEYGNGETGQNSDVEDRDMAINTGFKFSKNHKITLNLNYHYGDWGKPRGFNGPAKSFTKIRNEEENIHTNLSYAYTPGNFLETFKLCLYYDNGERDYFQYKFATTSGNLSSLDLVHYEDNYGGGRLFSIFNLSENNKLTAGVDAYTFRLDNPSEIIDYYNNTEGTSAGYKDAGQENFGAFVSDEWKISEKFNLQAGIRFDAAKVIEGESATNLDRKETRNALSGNVGIVYSPTSISHFSFNIGRAFRMPTAEELFTKVISCKGVKIGNPDLEAEYSWNFDLGWRGTSAQGKFKYDLALFYNKLDDFINEAPQTNDTDVDFTYKNTDAEIMGGEFSASYRFDNVFKASHRLYASLGASYVYGIDKSTKNDEALFGIPPLKSTVELKYHGLSNVKWITSYSFKLGAEYSTEQNRIPPVPEGTGGGPWGYIPSDSYCSLKCATGLKSANLPGKPQVRLIVNNILDNDYQPYGSYLPAMGRNFKILLSFNL